MSFLQIINKKKITLISIFLFMYLILNLFDGERGLISYFEKKNIINWVIVKNIKLRKNWIITTAVHSLQAIKNAEFFDIDAALLSPVFSSKSHPNKKNLGINKFSKIVKKTKLPIYALGGINIKNIKSLLRTDIIGYAFQRGE